ncbi:MAG TPA: metal-dependent transcriptional regulator [Anaeromyxobacter sp.]|nr:metal-dependent transcriptional regulator [Anaeromyxobacter sp.]
MSERSQREDEILEAVFVEREAGRDGASSILATAGGGASAEGSAPAGHAPGAGEHDLAALAAAGLVTRDGVRVVLTPEGERRAKDVVRRHRLTERLFRDLLAAGEDTMEAQACEFEHILSPEATESVCTLLGHPPTCPHGKPIPPGACCSAFQRTLRPLVTGLPSFPIGATGRIVFIAPKFHDRMDRLAALGVIPGSTVRLHQRAPSYVIEVGETTIALDPEIASEVYVKPVDAAA